jgi:hypothetical protein
MRKILSRKRWNFIEYALIKLSNNFSKFKKNPFALPQPINSIESRQRNSLEIESPLLQDASSFQGKRNAEAVRYDSRRIVCHRTGCRHRRAVDVATGRAHQWLAGRHFLPRRIVAIDSVSVKLDPECL